MSYFIVHYTNGNSKPIRSQIDFMRFIIFMYMWVTAQGMFCWNWAANSRSILKHFSWKPSIFTTKNILIVNIYLIIIWALMHLLQPYCLPILFSAILPAPGITIKNSSADFLDWHSIGRIKLSPIWHDLSTNLYYNLLLQILYVIIICYYKWDLLGVLGIFNFISQNRTKLLTLEKPLKQCHLLSRWYIF